MGDVLFPAGVCLVDKGERYEGGKAAICQEEFVVVRVSSASAVRCVWWWCSKPKPMTPGQGAVDWS